jgi:hypothetical protein
MQSHRGWRRESSQRGAAGRGASVSARARALAHKARHRAAARSNCEPHSRVRAGPTFSAGLAENARTSIARGARGVRRRSGRVAACMAQVAEGFKMSENASG